MRKTLASLRQGVLRPQDVISIYTQPHVQFRRLEKDGVLLKIAHGYYALIPEASRGSRWRPEVESLALGIGQADYGVNGAVLMHLSAARLQGAIPRAIAVAVVAIPKQRPMLQTPYGRIVFVQRDTARLKRMKVKTELGEGWSTNKEQTTLDLARRPDLVEGMSSVAHEAARTLYFLSDKNKLDLIANDQRLKSALGRVTQWAQNA